MGDQCAKCGKGLGFRDKHKEFQHSFYLLALQAGVFPEYADKQVCISCQGALLESKEIPTTGLDAFEKAQARINELGIATPVILNDEKKKAILWQKDEIPLGQTECKEFFEDRTISFGARIGHGGFLVVTNHRVLFLSKLGMLAKEYGVMYGADLENIVTVSHGRFGLNDKLVILETNNQHRDFINPNVHSVIPTLNSAITERKNQLQAQKEKEHLQIVLDFSSLKDVLSKGGIVMSACNCPKCNGMVDLPEVGKVLICKYCGTPIRPVDIFEKIKSFIQ